MTTPYPRVRVSGPIKSRSWHPDTGGVERIEERLLVRDLVRLAFFIPHDNFDIAAGVSHALDSYLRAVAARPEALALYTCYDWEPSRLDDRGWELIRRALRPEVRRYFEDYTPDEAFSPEKEGADPYFSITGRAVRELGGERAVVTLGPCPEAGDLASGQDLPAYRELAHVLERWQEPFPWSWLRREGRTNDEEELRRWWRRFLD